MSYLTPSDFKLRAFPSGSFNNISDSIIQAELDVAASEINAALRPFHTLPLNTGSYNSSSDLALIYNAEATITSYRLLMFRGFRPNINGTSDEVLQARYLEIVAESGILDKLSKGKLLLPGAADSTPNVREKRARQYGSQGRSYKITDSNGREYI
jgi:hypothetical protein